jgi:glycosyltransferase involved in cell wall biosynthesis
MIDLVSVIIPTYNRYDQLIHTIKSIKSQTHNNIEIIIINDRSTDQRYYKHDWNSENIIIVHLDKNSKEIYGFGCPQRNIGLSIAKGKYIAFCDDDDIWFPKKLEIQITKMKETNCKMSCTDSLIGYGLYDEHKNYKIYLGEHFYEILKTIYLKKGSNYLQNGFPIIWDLNFISIHNCIITSSVILEKDIVDTVGNFVIKSYAEDYEYWLRVLKHTNCVYINKPLIYYDSNHSGQ